jgi:hypothetical protein
MLLGNQKQDSRGLTTESIESTISEIHKMFQNLAGIVSQQGELIDR